MSSSRVLLLNASYEPLRIISISRAVGLMWCERCEIVEVVEGELLRSPSVTIPKPSVVRLINYVQVDRAERKTRLHVSTRTVLARDGWECCYCGDMADSIDHVHPTSRGGKNEWNNVVSACRQCNSFKADNLLEDLQNPETCPESLKHMNWVLRFEPFEPITDRFVQLGRQTNPLWSKYLV